MTRYRHIGWALTALGLVLALALWAYAQIPVAPYTLQDGDDTFSVAVTLDPARLMRPQGGCFSLTWNMQGIQTVTLNGGATIGENTVELCDSQPPVMRFVVTLPDGRLRWYDVPLTYTTRTTGYGTAVVVAVMSVVSGLYLLLDGVLRGRVRSVTLPRVPLGVVGRVWAWLFGGGLVFGLPIYGAVVYTLGEVRGPITADVLLIVFAVSLPLGAIIGAWVRPHESVPVTWGALLPLVFIVPLFVHQTTSIATQLGGDGINHAAFLYSVYHNGVPPENVWFAGVPANFYWLFHALFVLPMAAFGVPAGTSALIVSTWLVLGVVYWTGRLVLALGWANAWDGRLGLLSVVMLFSGNLLGVGYHAANALLNGGAFWSFGHLLDGHVNTAHIFYDIYRFTGFQMGIVFALITWTGLAGWARHGLNVPDALTAALGVVGAVAYHATSALFLIVNIPLAYGLTLLLPLIHVKPTVNTLGVHLRALGAWLRAEPVRVVGALVAFGVIAAPLAAYLLAVGGSNASTFGLHRAWMNVLLLAWPLFPLLALALWHAADDHMSALRFFFALGLVGLFNSAAMNLSGQADKFIVLGLLSWGVVAAYAVWRVRSPFTRLAVVLALLVTTDAVLSQILAPMDEPYQVSGVSLLEPAKDDNDLCVWVRENTPTDAVIIRELTSVWNSSVYLCERSLFLGQDYVITETLPDYYLREPLVLTLYRRDDPIEARLSALAAIRGYPNLTERPMYLQISGGPLETLRPHLDGRAEIVYSDDSHTLFLLR